MATIKVTLDIPIKVLVKGSEDKYIQYNNLIT